MMKKLDQILNKLEKLCNPLSVFIYGSRARDDFLKKSDFEIGVLIPKDRNIEINKIKKGVPAEKTNIYPFEYESFIKGNIDTPFQKSIYLRELITSGKTISGEKVIEKMEPPKIKVVDIIQDLRFNLGYALASVISHGNKDFETASFEFHKSCLFGTRDLEILQLKEFPLTYKEIYELSKNLEIGEYSSLVQKAYEVREKRTKYSVKDLFENISYLDEFIEPKIMEYFKKKGNGVLLNETKEETKVMHKCSFV